MKNLTKLVVSLLLVFSLVGCASNKETQVTTDETMTLNFTITDSTTEEPTVLFDGEVEVSANCETLADVLKDATDLEAELKESDYGLVIMGLMGVNGDWDKGPWWLYESENNESCIEAGYCDGASNLKVNDGDHFSFNLSSEF